MFELWKLNGSRVLINEQYPSEMEDKRKKKTIYPIMRKAKKDGKNVKLARDTLFIDGEVFTDTLIDLRVDSQMYSQKNAGDRLPKKK